MNRTRILLSHFGLSVLFIAAWFLISACGRQNTASQPFPEITLYAAPYSGGLHYSTNGGKSWMPYPADLTDSHYYSKRLFKFTEPGQFLYILTSGAGMGRLNLDTQVYEGFPAYDGEHLTALLKFDGKVQVAAPTLLAGLKNRGVVRLDGAMALGPFVNSGLVYSDVNVLFASGKQLFAGTDHDLFKWNEEKRRWESSAEGIQNKNISAMAAGPSGAIYVGCGRRFKPERRAESVPSFYKSEDNGNTWQPAGRGLDEKDRINAIGVIPGSTEVMLLGTSTGIYRSNDAAASWQREASGLPESMAVFDIKASAAEDSQPVAYAATSKGVFRTLVNASHWQMASYGLGKTAITSIVIH